MQEFSSAEVKFGSYFQKVLMMDCLESVSHDLWKNVILKPVFTLILKPLNLVTETAFGFFLAMEAGFRTLFL